EFLREAAQNRPLEIIFKRDDIAIYNSISTAEATLQIAMEETDYTIHGTKIAVLGFGRVGMTMGRLFHNVGAQTTVFARKSSDIARITEFGMQAAHLKDVKKKIHPFSICINTIPHRML